MPSFGCQILVVVDLTIEANHFMRTISLSEDRAVQSNVLIIFSFAAHLPAAMILSKHFFITFLKNTIRLPSLSSSFSNDELSFSDIEFDSKYVSSIFAAILKLSALFSRPRNSRRKDTI